MNLFALSECLIEDILVSWLKLENLATLDAAVSVHNCRKLFLRLAYEPKDRPIAYDSMHCLHDDNCSRKLPVEAFMRWILERRVPVAAISVTSLFEYDTQSRQAFLSKHGRVLQKIMYSKQFDETPMSRIALDDLCMFCPNIAEFSCAVNFPTSAYRQIGRAWPNLRAIHMGYLASDEPLLTIGTHCKQLTNFSCSEQYSVRKTWDKWATFLSLAGAALTHFKADIYDATIPEEYAAKISEYCPNLQAYRCPVSYLDVDFLTGLIGGCIHLTELDLTGASIGNEGLAVVARLGSQLRILRAADLNCITDASVVPLLQQCRQLRVLNLSKVPELTQNSYIAIGQCCPKLEILTIRQTHVSDKPKLRDEGVYSIAQGCQQLQQLDISGSGVTDAGLTALLTCCTRLTHLFISRSHGLTGDVFWRLPQLSPQLVQLSLFGCDVEMEHLPGLARGLRKLRYLAIPNDLIRETETALKEIKALFGSHVQVDHMGGSRRRFYEL